MNIIPSSVISTYFFLFLLFLFFLYGAADIYFQPHQYYIIVWFSILYLFLVYSIIPTFDLILWHVIPTSGINLL